MLAHGAELTLRIEKPAAGGRMIARHEGQVVLVGGVIPGELVQARIDRRIRGVVHASAIEILEPSPDRRSAADPACGGNLYAHIAYPRQLALKADIVADALKRIARFPSLDSIPIAPSPETGYRMRAKLHAFGSRLGFFREGTHDLCDAAGTGQLLPETLDVLGELSAGLQSEGITAPAEIEMTENIAATERAIHLELGQGGERQLGRLPELPSVTGLSCSDARGTADRLLKGRPYVTETLALDASGGDGQVVLRRHVRAFFQGNRFLLAHLVSRVLAAVPAAPVVDLYAGVGLFGVSLAASGRSPVIAVEGGWTAAADLRENSRPYGDALQVVSLPVEEYLRRSRMLSGATVILDPPRTGLSREASATIAAGRPSRIVYVSCDVATFARDLRALADAGYELASLEGFDLFPNTAHVEVMGVLNSRQHPVASSQ